MADPVNPPAWQRSSWRRRVLFVVVGLLAGLGIAELALRAVGFSSPIFHGPDPIYGTTIRPGVEGWWRHEGNSYAKMNSAGMRDVERTLKKPADTLRIAVLGDSMVEALQVDYDQTFCRVLERELTAKLTESGRKIEVLNFGCSGYGTGQELLTLKHKVAAYSPDVVLLAFLAGNDVADNSYAIDPRPRPYFRLSGDELVLDQSFLESDYYRSRTSIWQRMNYWLADHSRLVQLFNLVRIRRKSLGVVDRSAESPREPGLHLEVLNPPTDPRWVEAWGVTERELLEIQRECKHIGASLFVVTLSCSDQVACSPERRRKFQSAFHIDDLFYPEKRVAGWCEQHDVPCLMLPPRLQQYAESHNVDLHGFEEQPGYGHLNVLGQKIVGEEIAQWQAPLLEQLIDKSKSTGP